MSPLVTAKSALLVSAPLVTVIDTAPSPTLTPVNSRPFTSVSTTSPVSAFTIEALPTLVLRSAAPTPPMPVSAFKLSAPEVETFEVSADE